jgi:hypothetical protein
MWDSGKGRSRWHVSTWKLSGGKLFAATKSVVAAASLKAAGTKLECVRKQRRPSFNVRDCASRWQVSVSKLSGGKRFAATKSVLAAPSLKAAGTKLECL